ncbi:hypothetical protein [Streptomyces filamentosus]|uniref:hypothetical protein n=1 Tax=Streptomyces filamentosus TaxID=67294 RepID=UPI00123BABD0|nr:hypothetical protein [Streptomyces filamentosus]
MFVQSAIASGPRLPLPNRLLRKAPDSTVRTWTPSSSTSVVSTSGMFSGANFVALCAPNPAVGILPPDRQPDHKALFSERKAARPVPMTVVESARKAAEVPKRSRGRAVSRRPSAVPNAAVAVSASTASIPLNSSEFQNGATPCMNSAVSGRRRLKQWPKETWGVSILIADRKVVHAFT